MTLEEIKQMVHNVKAQGKTPQTLILTPDDAKSLNLPSWTKQFLGLKVIIATNWPKSEVVPSIYETVTIKETTDPKDLEEYRKSKQLIN